MEPILSKEEIADLLAAIRTGQVSTDSIDEGGPGGPIPKPVQDVDIFQVYVHDEDKGGMRIPNLDIILDTFTRNFGTTLTNQLQRTFSVHREEISTTSFQNSILDLKNQGAIGIYSTDPLKYGCLFHLDALLAFTLLEIMLGSAIISESHALARNLTTIEINILKNMMQGICHDLQKAFRPVITLKPKLLKVENNFRLVNIVDAETEVLVTSFSFMIAGKQAGSMRLIIPYLTLEPLREKFKEIVTVAQASYTWGKVLARETLEMEATVIARSGLLEMSIRQILDMKEGDIIELGYDPDQPLTIVVEDKPKFLAVPGERNGRKAFHVTGLYSERNGRQPGPENTRIQEPVADTTG
ncbi:flagellar motor switch protein FliM [Thermodesulfobacteriota bacterium B35]